MPDPMRDHYEERERNLEARISELEEVLWLIIAQAGTMADASHARSAIIETARRALKIEG